MSKLLGSGKAETLEESPLGKALGRVADAAMDFVKMQDSASWTAQGSELVNSAMDLSDMVLDFLEEMRIIEPPQGDE